MTASTPEEHSGQAALLDLPPVRSGATPEPAADPVDIARVVVDSPLPHLDRPFDYRIPAAMAGAVTVGCRVTVRFSGRVRSGFVVERVREPDPGGRLAELQRVDSSVPVLTAEVLALAQEVAARYAGVTWDVLRAAVPSRVAAVEKKLDLPTDVTRWNGRSSSDDDGSRSSDGAAGTADGDAASADGGSSSDDAGPRPGDGGAATTPTPEPAATGAHATVGGVDPGTSDESDGAAAPESRPTGIARPDGAAHTDAPDPAFALYPRGAAFLEHVRSGGSPRAVLDAAPGHGPHAWPELLASAIVATRASGRGAVAVVPDLRDLARLEAALAGRLPEGDVVRLSADDGPTPRYRNYLALRFGTARVAIGTRSAAWAPVPDLGLLCLWDDGDDLHVEPRAPYQHSREVLLLRAGRTGAAVLLAGSSRSTEAERLVVSGWAQPLSPDRATRRRTAPRVVSTADSVQSARDPLARVARLPQLAHETARSALTRGPVLVQVGRTGYAPALSCQRCRQPARCPHCSGPLAVSGRHAPPVCRWCQRSAPAYACPVCGGTALRMIAVGALRTADELGRAFPQVPVISSSGDHIRTEVPDEPALVVATSGAEPVAAEGYAAALLLDGDAMLERESLRAAEETVRRWFGAAGLVRGAADGGVVVVTAGESAAVAALVRWDAAGFAEREYALRRELSLPPAVRVAAVTGTPDSLRDLLDRAELPDGCRVIGPVPMATGADPAAGSPRTAPGEREERALVFFPYRHGAAVAAALKASRARQWAGKRAGPAHLRLDGLDLV
ncbi:primosomal protein N' [Tersicoccus sp. MR15.9]|uniref:primosomal protein N' family DNA-binding protein n=1 Tax=Tersicoccus mangrovi TaxID=3121635 RepID=UPI002FE699ED